MDWLFFYVYIVMTTRKKRNSNKFRKTRSKRGRGIDYNKNWMTEAKTKGIVIPTMNNEKILLKEIGFSMNPGTKLIIKPIGKSNIKYFVYDKNDCDTNHIKNCEPVSIFKPNNNNPYRRIKGGKSRKSKKKYKSKN